MGMNEKTTNANKYEVTPQSIHQLEQYKKIMQSIGLKQLREQIKRNHQKLKTYKEYITAHNLKAIAQNRRSKDFHLWGELLRSIRFMLNSSELYDYKYTVQVTELWSEIYKAYRIENFLCSVQKEQVSSWHYSIEIDEMWKDIKSREIEVFSNASWYKFVKLITGTEEGTNSLGSSFSSGTYINKTILMSVDQLFVDNFIFINMLTFDDCITIQMVNHLVKLMYDIKVTQIEKRKLETEVSKPNSIFQLLGFLRKVLMMRLLINYQSYSKKYEKELNELQILELELKKLMKDNKELEKQIEKVKEQVKILKRITGLDKKQPFQFQSLEETSKSEILQWKKDAEDLLSLREEIIDLRDTIDWNNYRDYDSPDLESYSESERIQSYTLSSDTQSISESYLLGTSTPQTAFSELNLQSYCDKFTSEKTRIQMIQEAHNEILETYKMIKKILTTINPVEEIEKKTFVTSVDHLLSCFNKKMDFDFIKLQKNYHKFYQTYITHKCIYCRKRPRKSDTALCLSCGAVICIGRCPDVRPQNYETHRKYHNLCNHIYEEHAGCGIFIDIMKGSYIIYQDLRWYEFEGLYSDKIGLSVKDYDYREVDKNDFELNEVLLEKLRQSYIKHRFLDMVVSAKRKYKKVMRRGDV